MEALAETFFDDITVVVSVLSKPSATGLCKVMSKDGRTFARHVDRLDAINQEAYDLIHPCPPRP